MGDLCNKKCTGKFWKVIHHFTFFVCTFWVSCYALQSISMQCPENRLSLQLGGQQGASEALIRVISWTCVCVVWKEYKGKRSTASIQSWDLLSHRMLACCSLKNIFSFALSIWSVSYRRMAAHKKKLNGMLIFSLGNFEHSSFIFLDRVRKEIWNRRNSIAVVILYKIYLSSSLRSGSASL